MSGPTVLEVLTKARELIAKGWAQGAYAVDDEGTVVRLADATAFCPAGAILCQANFATRDDAFDMLKHVVGTNIVGWNDARDRTQAEVLAAFDRAISLAAERRL
jgi:hypothetical protein